eukprot:TRINITY_DN1_c0_g1_i11.p1 TRINITY_DN1_c0_g1~~TRINITY_DN1_c0_g1_i11.p1  ORF type:complete len:180 (-),score=37.46 TRINITY_DN1_c0_g1_i11:7-546(-)
MAARRRRASRKRRVSRKRRTSRKRRVSRKRRRVSRKKRVVKRRKARKPTKKDTGNRRSVWDGKAKKTKDGMTKRSLCEFNGKIVPKTFLIGTKGQVFRGTKQKTAGGLTKKDLMKNKHGQIVSKKKYKSGLKIFKKATGLKKWSAAVQTARKELGITGWCNVKKGTPLYKKAKQLYSAM